MIAIKEIKKTVINIQVFKIITLILYFIKVNPVIGNTLFIKGAIILTLLWGTFLIIYYFFKRKDFFKKVHFYLLGLFFLSYAVSIILNINVAALDNIRNLGWFCVTVTVFMWPTSDDTEKNISNYVTLLKIYVIIAFIFTIISIPFVFVNLGGKINDIRYGFYFHRLYGVYRSPNYGTIYASVALVTPIYLLGEKNNKIVKNIFYLLSAILQFLYITYSGSRSGFICLCCGIVVYGIYYIIMNHNNIKKLLLTLTCITIGLYICIYSMDIIKNYTTQTLNNANDVVEGENIVDNQADNNRETTQNDSAANEKLSNDFNNPDTNENGNTLTTETPVTKAPSIDFNMSDTKKYGITNGRSYNWKVGFEVFRDYRLFGTTMRGYGVIAKKYDSGARTQSEYLTLENDFISIVICTGIVGSILMLTVILIIIYKLMSGLYYVIKNKNYEEMQNIWISLVIFAVIGISMAFTDAVIFSNTIQSFMFWSSLDFC